MGTTDPSMSMISKDAEAANEAGIELSPDPNAPLKLPVNASKLTKWNAAMSLFHGVFAAITLAVGNTDLAVPVYGSGVKVIVGGLNGTNVGTNATGGWALTPDFSSVSSHIHLTWAVACFFGLSCLFHLGNATFLKKFYIRALEKGYAPFRWIEYSMSASVMILILAYTSGTTTQRARLALRLHRHHHGLRPPARGHLPPQVSRGVGHLQQARAAAGAPHRLRAAVLRLGAGRRAVHGGRWLVRHRLPGREEPDADLRLRHRLRRAAHLLGLRPRAAHRLAPPARQVLSGRDRVHVAFALRQGRARPARAEQRPCARQLHRYLCVSPEKASSTCALLSCSCLVFVVGVCIRCEPFRKKEKK